MKKIKISVLLALIFLPLFSFAQTNNGDTLWAKSTTAGSDQAEFMAVTAASNGDYYAVGYMTGTGTYGFGNGVTVSGPDSGENSLLVKYDTNGNTAWAKSFVSGTSDSGLSGVSTDSDGNVYVVGYIDRNGIYDLGDTITISGSAATAGNIFLAKYDSSGKALWAKSTISGPNSPASFQDVVVDNSGNVYVAGHIGSTSTYDFGNGVTAAGSYGGSNIILIKYDANGDAQWAKTVSGSTGSSQLNSVAVDDYDNPHVGGYIYGTSAFNFGNNVNVTSPSNYNNILVAKYNSTGYAQFAKTITSSSSPNHNDISAIAVESNGDIFASGYVTGANTFSFADGVNTTGVFSGANGLLLKYNSAGQAQWARTPTTAPDQSKFYGVGLGCQGNVYVGGFVQETGQFDFGNNIATNGTGQINLVLVNYNSDGYPVMAKSVTSGNIYTQFYGLHTNYTSPVDIYAVGYEFGTDPYDLGNNITVNGSYGGNNPFIVKYRGAECSVDVSSSASSNSTAASSSTSSGGGSVASKVGSIKPKLFMLGSTVLLLL